MTAPTVSSPSTTANGAPPAASTCESASRTVHRTEMRLSSTSTVPASSSSTFVQRRQPEPLERAVGAHELGDELVRRMHQQIGRRVVLGEHPALAQDRDAVTHLDRLVDVVGDEHDGLAQPLLEAQKLVLQATAVDRVDRPEGLVHQHQRRVSGERAGHADALALAARELGRIALADLLVETDQLEQLLARAPQYARAPSRAAAGPWRCSR